MKHVKFHDKITPRNGAWTSWTFDRCWYSRLKTRQPGWNIAKALHSILCILSKFSTRKILPGIYSGWNHAQLIYSSGFYQINETHFTPPASITWESQSVRQIAWPYFLRKVKELDYHLRNYLRLPMNMRPIAKFIVLYKWGHFQETVRLPSSKLP